MYCFVLDPLAQHYFPGELCHSSFFFLMVCGITLNKYTSI